MNTEQAKELLKRYRLGLCTEEEKAAIETWYEELSKKSRWEWTSEERGTFNSSLKMRIRERIKEDKTLPVIGKKRFSFLRVAAAAAIVGLLGVSAYYLFIKNDENKQLALDAGANQYDNNEVEQGHYGAILTVANGEEIKLDSTADGTLIVQGGVKVLTSEGKIIYSAEGGAKAETLYNTISTPKGRQYQLLLSDGTKVWLNAASSIRYPVTFSATERSVEMTGEAYFEVAKVNSGATNSKVPFTVRAIDGDHDWGIVKVLGTQFNINSYGDEGVVKTTLVEGSVVVNKAGVSELLKPGQQSQVSTAGSIDIVDNADVNAEISWKNGFFSYDNTDIRIIMKQLSRWYDIEVDYEGDASTTQTFWGDIPRGAALSSVLKTLKNSGIKLIAEDKKVTVLSQ